MEEGGSAKKKATWSEKLRRAAMMVVDHVRTHAGVGMVCAVAYFDPGNWGVDLRAGSEYGYRLLFVVLLAGLIAVFFQVLASRLGCVTGLDLASHCRLLLHRTPRGRWLGLYPLYVLSEIAIIATDLAELLGSAIALVLLFPKLQLWHGVLITTFDVLFLLAMGDPLGKKPLRWFEWVISGLVLAVLICMCIILARVDIDWGDAFFGYLPSKYIFPNGALYTSVGILGATVMPHSLFLGSALATQDRTPDSEQPESDATAVSASTRAGGILSRTLVFFIHAFKRPPPNTSSTSARRHSERENNSLQFVKAHMYHGIVDVSFSLLGFAVLINSSILIISSAVFFQREGKHKMPAGLFQAYDLIEGTVGEAAATLFAIALLAAGQSASVIATVAGQAVSEGFLRWRTSPVLRRLLTRLLSVIPSMTVAVAVGRDGIDSLLVISQVVLSVVLPFITFPLIYLTSRKEVMRVRARRPELIHSPESFSTIRDAVESKDQEKELREVRREEVDVVETLSEPVQIEPRGPESPSYLATTDSEAHPQDEYVYFNNGVIVILIGWAIWLLVLAANTFVIVTLALGKGDG
ncbi:natural resistance-associated macrophage protein [Marasmius fiardii PR-910]|nr:natural resistance-associated macrophage protein [Marasmius fiardii PR-910]